MRKWVIAVDDNVLFELWRQGLPFTILHNPNEWESDLPEETAEIFKGAVIISAFKNNQFFIRNVEGKAFKIKVKDSFDDAWIEIDRREHLDA